MTLQEAIYQTQGLGEECEKAVYQIYGEDDDIALGDFIQRAFNMGYLEIRMEKLRVVQDDE